MLELIFVQLVLNFFFQRNVLCRKRKYVCEVKNYLGGFRVSFMLQPNFTEPLEGPDDSKDY